MAWLHKLNDRLTGRLSLTLSALVLATVALTGCNVGKTDTVTTTTAGTTTTTTTTTGAARSCTGSYVGNYGPPSHEERIRLRNLSLTGRGIAVTGNDDIDNANAGGGSPDGGIWMGGSYAFETDANCNVVNGRTMIFYAYEYGISGTVNKDGSFKLIWSGQGSQGDLFGTVDANNNISGEFHHPAPDSFVYGVMSGTFTPNGKI
ncbi:MAG: hypothetical protein Q7K57_50875 [Burkholderiaceae bacterium]|nr:hypothetical protein [Burkholderiaceae bacterium]